MSAARAASLANSNTVLISVIRLSSSVWVLSFSLSSMDRVTVSGTATGNQSGTISSSQGPFTTTFAKTLLQKIKFWLQEFTSHIFDNYIHSSTCDLRKSPSLLSLFLAPSFLSLKGPLVSSDFTCFSSKCWDDRCVCAILPGLCGGRISSASTLPNHNASLSVCFSDENWRTTLCSLLVEAVITRSLPRLRGNFPQYWHFSVPRKSQTCTLCILLQAFSASTFPCNVWPKVLKKKKLF